MTPTPSKKLVAFVPAEFISEIIIIVGLKIKVIIKSEELKDFSFSYYKSSLKA